MNFANFIRPDIDFADYLRKSETKAMVIPAGAYADDLAKSFISHAEVCGDSLPWQKLHGHFQLRAKELTIWFGYKGHGKSMVLSEIMLSCMQSNRKVLVISPEFSPIEVLRRKVRQSATSITPSERYVRAWADWANARLWMFDKQSKLDADLVLGVCAYAIGELKVNHIVIDSLMKCGMGVDDYNGQKSFVDRLQHLAHKSDDTHIHLICHARKGMDDNKPPSLHDAKGASEITDLAENVVTIHMDKQKKITGDTNPDKPDVVITIEAQRNHPHLGRYALWFAPGLRFVGQSGITPLPIFTAEK